MQSFGQYVQSLNEKLIVLGGGANYGQIVFLAGGGGSGKGFAANNFMEVDKFRVRDVDAMKSTFLALNKLFGELKNLPPCDKERIVKPDNHFGGLQCNPFHELTGMNLRNPSDVFALHAYTDKLGIKDKTLKMMMDTARHSQGHLPNIMFDITAKNIKAIASVIKGDGHIPGLIDVGYQPKNIHLVWILADYSVAVHRNAKRSRVVPDDVLLTTHEGAATTMWQILKGDLPGGMDGGVYVVLNRDLEAKDFYPDTGNRAEKSAVSIIHPTKTVKDFTYIRYKDAGHPMAPKEDVQKQIYDWIVANIPKSKNTAHIFDAGQL